MPMDEQYRRGYAAGYADGVRDAVESKVKPAKESLVASIPVKGMVISTRAINCLIAAGCRTVLDVSELSEFKISRMRNMGKKTAHEIACWLMENGINDSAWSAFL